MSRWKSTCALSWLKLCETCSFSCLTCIRLHGQSSPRLMEVTPVSSRSYLSRRSGSLRTTWLILHHTAKVPWLKRSRRAFTYQLYRQCRSGILPSTSSLRHSARSRPTLVTTLTTSTGSCLISTRVSWPAPTRLETLGTCLFLLLRTICSPRCCHTRSQELGLSIQRLMEGGISTESSLMILMVRV